MNGPLIYILDANVFMEAARRYYAFDIAPTFWQALVEHAENGQLLSIDRVKKEIDRGKDMLTDWANSEFNQWFISTDDPNVIDSYSQIITWAQRQDQFNDSAKEEFYKVDNADPWVVAFSMAKRCIVVTHEQFDSNVRVRIPIPNVCQAFGVEYIDTFLMLRDLGVRLG